MTQHHKSSTNKAFPILRPNRGHSKPLPLSISLDQPGRLRAGHLQSLFAVSLSTLHLHISAGHIPPPDGRDRRRPYWNTKTIRDALQKGSWILRSLFREPLGLERCRQNSGGHSCVFGRSQSKFFRVRICIFYGQQRWLR